MSLPILYRAIVSYDVGKEAAIDLTEKGWLLRPELMRASAFTLVPIESPSILPTVSVSLEPLKDGTPRRLVYFSRLFGTVGIIGSTHTDTPLARVYCLGWQATVGGRNVKALNWIYPSGAIVAADEPPFTEGLIAALAAKN